ncbi:hypothetical protein ACHAQJ_008192 [Trichoderma viride]
MSGLSRKSPEWRSEQKHSSVFPSRKWHPAVKPPVHSRPRPQCSPCVGRSITCEYNNATVPVAASTFSDIETRLRRLEQQATTATSQSPPRIAVSSFLNAATPSHQLSGLLHRNSLSAQGPPNPSAEGTNTSLDWASERPIVDFPTARFIRDIAQIADDQPTRQRQTSLWGKADNWLIETDTSAIVVPDKATADELVLCYEQYVYPLFPLLHMPTFRESYELLWQPQGQAQFESLASKVTFCGVLNIVFALGCLNNSHIERQLKLRTADKFYQRTRALLPLDALDVPSIGVVQCLLLTTIYLSCTKYSHRCCNTLAVAIRVAHTLGLHMTVEPTSSNQLAREMSARVWYHCITLERLFPTILGRKTMLDPCHDLALPEKIDDEYLLKDGLGVQPPGIPSVLDAFVVSIRIFEVIDGAWKLNYDSFKQNLGPPKLSQVLQFNEKVDEIESNLPPHLRIGHDMSPYGSRGRLLQLQAETVLARILHLRLVLLRPNVLVAARQSVMPWDSGPTPSQTETALRTELSRICVRAAVSAIEILHSNMCSSSQIFSSHAAFVTLSAAIVIVAASLVPELDVLIEGPDELFENTIAKAFEILNEVRWNEGVSGAKGQLERFIGMAKQAKTRGSGARSRPPDAQSQEDILQMPSDMPDTIGGIDFSDPLWDFSWGGPYSFLNMPGPMPY